MDAASRDIDSKSKACGSGFSSTVAFLSSKATIALTAPPSFHFTMQVDSEHKHIPSRKPQKDLQPTDLDEKLTALHRRTAR